MGAGEDRRGGAAPGHADICGPPIRRVIVAKPVPKKRDRNHILAALPTQHYRRIEAKLEVARFERSQPLHPPDKPISHVYFPRTGVASVVSRVSEGGTIEVATIGNEGVVGVAAYLADGRSPMEVFVQVPGEAVRMSADAFRQEIRAGGPLRDIVRRYTQALLNQLGRSAVCNRVHPTDERCARWLLMSHDRVLGDQVALTQEFLAEMLGVRRATVTRVAGLLKKRKLIDYHRGTIRVLDREGLERASCDCYSFIRSEHERLVG
jgi:CRP-like cAMP-binding protein